jgi:hypothetical protein
MTLFPLARRRLLAAAGFFALAAAALAQDPPKAGAPAEYGKNTRAKVTLSLTSKGSAPTTLTSRPNNQVKVFVVIDHDAPVPEKTYRVQLIGPKETTLAPAKTVTVTKGTPLPLAFEPPAPKKDAPKKEEPAPKKDDAAPPAEPAPGFPLPVTAPGDGTRSFKFIIRVTNDPPRAGETPDDFEQTLVVQNPPAYIAEPQVYLTGAGTRGKGVVATVKAEDKKPDPAKPDAPKVDEFVPKVPVNLVFPSQLGVRTTELRAGTYSRDIFRTGQTVELSANNLPLTRRTDKVKFHLDIDGYARAFTYTLDVNRLVSTTASENRIQPDPRVTPLVRLYPVSASKRARDISDQVTSGTLATPKYPTLPVKDLRFKIEVDNAPGNATLELKVDRAGNRSFAAPDETLELGGPRDVKVWLDPGTDGGLWTLTNAVADHVKGVDVSALRGAHALQAVLRIPNLPQEQWPRAEYTLLVDDTPPPAEDVDFDYTKFPKRHVKGVPLEVRVQADDPESEVEKVTFYLGKPGPDGKIPDGTPKFVGVRQNVYGRDLNLWVAQVELPAPAPADPKAPPAPPAPPKAVEVTAVAENGVGLQTPRVVRIELVDPKGGTIHATVKRGGRPQADVEVTLRDAEGKEKGVVKTKADGVARFINLPPGPYRLYAGKPDASTGLIGNTVVTIPDPPLTRPMEIDLDMAKRR